MKKILSLALAVVVVMGMLAGCAAKPESQETAVQDEVQGNQEAVTSSAYPMVYTDALGTVLTIEKKPERIAVSYLPYWEYLVALDYAPVAASMAERYKNTWDPFKKVNPGDVTDLGDKEINLEKLAEVAPDLILIPSKDDGLENLQQIAPVIVLDPKVRLDWRFGLREIGKLIDKEDAAEQKITEIEGTIKTAREKLQTQYKDETVIVMSLMGKDAYYCNRRPDFFSAETGLGLKAPEGFPTENTYVQVSMEALAKMNPDHVFVAVFDGDEGVYEELSQNPVWKTINAVKNNHVHVLDGAAHASSVLATEYAVNAIVDELLK